MEEKRKIVSLKIIITILVVLIISLLLFIVYDKILSDNPNDDNVKSENNVETEEYVTQVIIPSEFDKQENIEEKILLDNKIRKLKINLEQEKYVSIDDKIIFKPELYLEYLDSIYIIGNEIIMIVTAGSDIRSEKYYFYNSNLKEIAVDMTLDREYPSMVLQSANDDAITVSDNKIVIAGTRLTHGLELVSTYESIPVSMCQYNENTKKYELIEDVYKIYKDSPVEAKYEIEYLGNGQFAPAKRIEIIKVVDESYCKLLNEL